MTIKYDHDILKVKEEDIMMITAGKFKAQCLKIMDDVQKNHREVIITKYGKPVAKLVGVEPKVKAPLFGFLKNSVIRPQLFLKNLKIWHSAKPELNKEAHAQAEDLYNRIENGEDMASLAKAYTQDESGRLVWGDLGFVNSTELLAEIREGVENAKIGERKIIFSRYGIHIIQLEEKNKNLLRLRQIFIADNKFENWLNEEFKKIKIYKFINF